MAPIHFVPALGYLYWLDVLQTGSSYGTGQNGCIMCSEDIQWLLLQEYIGFHALAHKHYKLDDLDLGELAVCLT